MFDCRYFTVVVGCAASLCAAAGAGLVLSNATHAYHSDHELHDSTVARSRDVDSPQTAAPLLAQDTKV